MFEKLKEKKMLTPNKEANIKSHSKNLIKDLVSCVCNDKQDMFYF